MYIPDSSIFALAQKSNILTAPSEILEVFLFIGFFLHILSVNMVTGLAMAIFLRRFVGAGVNWTASSGNDAFWLSKGLAFNVNLAIVPLLFLQALYAPFIYTVSIIMGLWFISIPIFVMMAYYGLYLFNMDSARNDGRNTLIMAVVIMIFLGVAFIYTNLNSMIMAPQRWPLGQGNPSGLDLNLGDPIIWARYTHNVFGIMAFGGLAQAILAEVRIRRGATGQESAKRFGLTVFAYAVGINILTGMWYRTTTTAEVQSAFMGGDPLATAALSLGAVGSLIAIFTALKGRLVPTAVLAVIVLLCMCFLRHMMRKIILAPYVDGIASKYFNLGPFALFMCGLAATVVVLVIIMRKALKNNAENPKVGARS